MAMTPAARVTSGFFRVHLWVLMGINTLASLALYSAYSLELDLSSKQRLLAEWNVDLRAVMLLEQLRMLARGEQPAAVKFPPGFSNN